VSADFKIYVSKPGAGIGFEDYFTTEAMGCALTALQQHGGFYFALHLQNGAIITDYKETRAQCLTLRTQAYSRWEER
jgi:hypothetical protein